MQCHRPFPFPVLTAALLSLVSGALAQPPAPSDPTEIDALLAAPPLALGPITTPDTSALEEAVRDQLDEAELATVQALEAQATSIASLGETYGRLGMHYHAYELADAADASYRNAIQLAPQATQWHFLLGELLRQQGDLDAAAIALESVLAAQPKDLGALVGLGEVELERNNPETASSYFSRALETAPETAAARAGLGQAALALGDAAKAVRLLEEVLKQVPAATRLHHPLGLAYRQLGDLDQARTHLRARGDAGVRVNDPRLAALAEVATGERVYLLRGRRAFAAGDFEQAAKAFAQAAEADPASARARVNLGTALGQSGDTEGAVAAYQEAIELEPRNTTAHFNLGQLLVASQPEAALQHFEQAVATNPGDPVARVELGRLLRRAGRIDDAVEQLAFAISADPDDEQSYLAYASTLVQVERFAEAISSLDSANAAMPHAGRIAFALARLLAACPDKALRDGERAHTLASQVFQASRTPEHAHLVALAAAEQGNCDEAATWQEKAIEAVAEVAAEAQRASMAAALAHFRAGPPCRP